MTDEEKSVAVHPRAAGRRAAHDMAAEDNRITEDFQRALAWLVGKVCWGAIAGPPSGSIVSLDFGSKVRRTHPVPNPHLSAEQREFEGEFSLFVECAWRVDSKTHVVGGWTEPNAPGGPMVTAVQSLIGATVDSVHASPPGWDLAVHLSNGLYLKLFCDQLDAADSAANYAYFVPGNVYTVGVRSTLQTRSRTVLTSRADASRPPPLV